jgi:predicted 3-demethylubiquinone-9 3-methyltransferase (glyoxalase superfamily)
VTLIAMSSGWRDRQKGMTNIIPSLWFDTQALEAAEFYCSIFPQSKITSVARYTEAGPGEPGTVLSVDFELDGKPVNAINGGPIFQFSEATSLIVECKDQAEIDRYWDALLAGGGEESQCGWLKDKYGFSWQIVPEGMGDFFASNDEAAITRAMKAMFEMKKIDVAALDAAAKGATV